MLAPLEAARPSLSHLKDVLKALNRRARYSATVESQALIMNRWIWHFGTFGGSLLWLSMSGNLVTPCFVKALNRAPPSGIKGEYEAEAGARRSISSVSSSKVTGQVKTF